MSLTRHLRGIRAEHGHEPSIAKLTPVNLAEWDTGPQEGHAVVGTLTSANSPHLRGQLQQRVDDLDGLRRAPLQHAGRLTGQGVCANGAAELLRAAKPEPPASHQGL